MKIEDLEQGTIVAMEDVMGDQTSIVALFKGLTTGDSGHFPKMFFWNLTAMACGTKNAAPIIIDPMTSIGEIIVLLTPREYNIMIEGNKYTMIEIFSSLEAVTQEDKSRIISLPPSK